MRKTTTLTISPNDDIKVGDILTVRSGTLGVDIQGVVVSKVDKTVLIMNPSLWQRVKMYCQDQYFELKMFWWRLRR